MLKIWLVGIIAAACLSGMAEFTNLKEFKNAPQENFIPLMETFNDGLAVAKKSGWQLPKTAKWDEHGGLTGSGALLLERKDVKDKESGIASIPLKLTPEKRYRFVVNYRMEGVNHGRAFPLIKRTTADGITTILDSSPRCRSNGSWHKKVYEFKAGVKNILICQLWKKTGKIWFDDIRVEPSEKNADFYLTRPHKLTLGKENRVEYKAYIDGIKSGKNTDYLVYVELAGQKAAAKLGKDNKADVFFKDIPNGKYSVHAKLLDLKKKQIVAEDSTVLFKRPVSGALLDDKGRIILDGKPVLAIGIYSCWLEKESEVKQIADAGFTFIIDYSSRWMHITSGPIRDPEIRNKESKQQRLSGYFKLKAETPEGSKQVKAGLDVIQKYGLKYIPFCGNSCQVFHYPAVIGHYNADEVPINQIPAKRKHREMLAEKFPDHLTLGLTDKINDCITYAKAFDVFGYDVYPIRSQKHPSMLSVRKYTLAQKKTGIAGMFVPQAFCWYGFGGRKQDRLPTPEELRSMVLLPAIYGVRIYCYFSYTSLWVRNKGLGVKGVDEFWEKGVIHSVECLRKLEPWLLSDERAPKVRIVSRGKSIVDAKAFSHDEKLRVVITACGPGEANADIFVGRAGLKSVYGHTASLGGGWYRFTGTDIASDVLAE